VMKNILVLCTGNSCRSQMAEGYLRHFAEDKARVFSAGVEQHGLNPKAVWAMKEDGIDISHHTSNLLDDCRDLDLDFVISVCDHAKEKCPYFPFKTTRIHQNFADPSTFIGQPEEVNGEFIRVRDLIKTFCKSFVDENLQEGDRFLLDGIFQ